MADTKEEEMGGRSRTDGRATHITRHIDDRKEWCCCLCSETNVWTRSRCRRCQTNIPSVLQDQHMQAVSTKSGRSWSESAPSGEGDQKVLAHEAQWDRETELRELRQENKRL